jgi:predicted metalloendopeptidase
VTSIVRDLHLEGTTVLFEMAIFQDLKESEQYIAYAIQGGLGLPDRDYYTREDEESAELRNPANYYNIQSLADSDGATPAFSWSAYFDRLGLGELETFSYAHPRFFAVMNEALEELPLDTWKSYLRWHLINHFSPYLSAAVVNADFEFYGKTLHVNGELTLGENIGDLAGTTMAYYALQEALKENDPGEIDGFTPNQRFFLSWAQAWRRNYRDEAIKLQVNTNPHSPSKFRANGPMTNMPEFAAAWGCVEGDAMVQPAELRADIW